MKFFTYLRVNAGVLVALVLSSLLSQFVLVASGMGAEAIAFVLAIEWVCVVAWLVVRYVRVAGESAVFERIAGSESPLDVVAEMPRSLGGEASSAVEAIDAVASDATSRLTKLSADMAEQRRYTEAWVHEIKTPIATAGLVLENNPDAATPELLEELERIDGYVEQALYFSRARVVEKDYAIKPVNVSTLVNDSVRAKKRMLIHSQVRIVVHDVDDTVLTDDKWIRFILGQLLDNAVKYRRSDEPQTVEIWGERRDFGGANEAYVLHVQDTGRGIAEPDLGRIFEMGYVGRNGRDADARKSTGIGLYLVKTLCDKLGVGVSVASDSCSYTEFELAFPMNMMHHVDRAE
jgi:signal transduction histidine kinase